MVVAFRTGFHTVLSGIDPGDHRFCPRFGGVIAVWKDLRCGDDTLSSPGVAISTDLGFHTVRGVIDPGDHRFRPWFFVVADVCIPGIFMTRGWDLILPGWRWLYLPQLGVCTSRGAVSTRGTTRFVPSLVDSKMYRRIYEMGRDTNWGFHTVRGVTDPEDHCFRPPFVVIV